MIHAVTVVPMWAPRIIEMACMSVRSPALTKETVINVVAVELCTEAVTNMPVSIPVKRFVVMVPSTCLSCGPAIFCKASLMDFIPNISRARHPNIFNAIQVIIIGPSYEAPLPDHRRCLSASSGSWR